MHGTWAGMNAISIARTREEKGGTGEREERERTIERERETESV